MNREDYIIKQRDVEICCEEMMGFTGQNTLSIKEMCLVYQSLIKASELRFKIDTLLKNSGKVL